MQVPLQHNCRDLPSAQGLGGGHLGTPADRLRIREMGGIPRRLGHFLKVNLRAEFHPLGCRCQGDCSFACSRSKVCHRNASSPTNCAHAARQDRLARGRDRLRLRRHHLPARRRRDLDQVRQARQGAPSSALSPDAANTMDRTASTTRRLPASSNPQPLPPACMATSAKTSGRRNSPVIRCAPSGLLGRSPRAPRAKAARPCERRNDPANTNADATDLGSI